VIGNQPPLSLAEGRIIMAFISHLFALFQMQRSSRGKIIAIFSFVLIILHPLAVTAVWSQTNVAEKRQIDEITLGWNKSTANLAPFLSPQFSEKFGLKIELINFSSGVDTVTALISGQINIGQANPLALIRAVDRKIDLVQICGNTRGNSGIVAAKSLGLAEGDWDGLKRIIRERKDKKLRLASSRGSINELVAISEFASHGIDVNKDLDLVNILNFAQHPQALRSGEFDMVVTFEPLITLSVAEGTGTLLSHPYSTAAGDLNTAFIARREWVLNNPEKTARFVATIVATQKALQNDKKLELNTAIKMTGVKAEILATALKNNRYEPRNGLDQMKALAKIAAEQKYTSRNVADELLNSVDDQFLRALGIAQ
jgi:ABC-type nitrate/sulfonate/bicarbonate transport system substrate-binding protein